MIYPLPSQSLSDVGVAAEFAQVDRLDDQACDVLHPSVRVKETHNFPTAKWLPSGADPRYHYYLKSPRAEARCSTNKAVDQTDILGSRLLKSFKPILSPGIQLAIRLEDVVLPSATSMLANVKIGKNAKRRVPTVEFVRSFC